MYRHNKTKKAQKVSRQIYKEAFEPFRADCGRNTRAARATSIFTVVENLLDPTRVHLKVAPVELAAIDRLIDAILDAEEYGYGPDIIDKAFSDLDLVFSNRRLRSNVCVQWASDKQFQQWQMPPGAWGFTVRPQRGESGQCRVKLNAKTILLDSSTDTSFKTMFGTMLHEMCHAYEHIRCSPEECNQGDEHDKHFRTKIHAVHRRAHHLLGLWAIDKRESYRKDHFMSQDWSKEWTDMSGITKEQRSKEDKIGDREERSTKPKTNAGKRKGGESKLSA